MKLRVFIDVDIADDVTVDQLAALLDSIEVPKGSVVKSIDGAVAFQLNGGAVAWRADRPPA